MRVTQRLPSKAASRQVSVQAPPRLVPLGAACLAAECREGGRVLSPYPALRDVLRELVVRHFFGIEYLLDGTVGQLRRDSFFTKFGGEACLAPWAVAKAVAYEGGRNRFVVQKATFLEPIEAGVDAGPVEALLTESSPEFRACARSV